MGNGKSKLTRHNTNHFTKNSIEWDSPSLTKNQEAKLGLHSSKVGASGAFNARTHIHGTAPKTNVVHLTSSKACQSSPHGIYSECAMTNSSASSSDGMAGGSQANASIHSTCSKSKMMFARSKPQQSSSRSKLTQATAKFIPTTNQRLAEPFRSASLNETGSRDCEVDVEFRRHSTSLQHISERRPSQNVSTESGRLRSCSPFYSSLPEDKAAFETAKNLRKAMKIRYKGNVGLGGISDKRRQTAKSARRNSFYKLGPGQTRFSNSCSTLFVDQTVSRPDLEQILFCAATGIYLQFTRVAKLQSLPLYDSIFDERTHPLTSKPVPANYNTRCPPVSDIFDFLRAFFKAAVLKADVGIIALVYVNRMQTNGVLLQMANWRRIVLGAVLLASKAWDDQAVWNADFCKVLPDVPLESLNALERKVLEHLDYNVGVSAGEYAQHYFELRQTCYRAVREEGYVFSPLTLRKALRLDAVSQPLTEKVQHDKLTRSSSCENLPTLRRPIVLS